MVDINGEDHALGAVALGRAVGLLAVEVALAVIGEGVVEGVEVGGVAGDGVVEVGVDGAVFNELGTRGVEGGFRKSVIFGVEVEVDDGALFDVVDEGRIEAKGGTFVEADVNCLNGGGGLTGSWVERSGGDECEEGGSDGGFVHFD